MVVDDSFRDGEQSEQGTPDTPQKSTIKLATMTSFRFMSELNDTPYGYHMQLL